MAELYLHSPIRLIKISKMYNYDAPIKLYVYIYRYKTSATSTENWTCSLVRYARFRDLTSLTVLTTCQCRHLASRPADNM
jgi:hypothetical protein